MLCLLCIHFILFIHGKQCEVLYSIMMMLQHGPALNSTNIT